MPIPKEDYNSGAMIFYPTPQELRMIEDRKANKRAQEEIIKFREEALEAKKEVESLRDEMRLELEAIKSLRKNEEDESK